MRLSKFSCYLISGSLLCIVQPVLAANSPEHSQQSSLTYTHFQKLDRGMEETQVISILGRPVGIVRPQYSSKRAADKSAKTDQTGFCFVYIGVDNPGLVTPAKREWLVAFSNNKVIFWDVEDDCTRFFDD